MNYKAYEYYKTLIIKEMPEEWEHIREYTIDEMALATIKWWAHLYMCLPMRTITS